MTFRRKITIAALVLLGILLTGLAALGSYDIYWNHIAKECCAVVP